MMPYISWTESCIPGAQAGSATASADDGTGDLNSGGVLQVPASTNPLTCPSVMWFWIASIAVGISLIVQPFNKQAEQQRR